ncbi:hypothetical protein [Mycobacterium phage WXIN]|nr:hypothetical protein [Mycobacterium phage WXIN]
MKTSEFIAEARDELFQGWTQGSYRSAQGVCVLGALDRVVMRHLTNGGVTARAEAQVEISKMAQELFPDIWQGNIPSLNDYFSTTKDDMLNLLDKSVIGLEEVGR